MINSDIAKVLPKNIPIYADSAEPKSIEEIRRFGVPIKPVTKGKDSINFGIQIMQGQEYLVTKDSTNLIKELRGYCWDKGKDGKTLPIPVGVHHQIDSVRYHEMETLGLKKNFGNYDIR
jgi:phage terminase large subunit